jgi:hypothetical protein
MVDSMEVSKSNNNNEDDQAVLEKVDSRVTADVIHQPEIVETHRQKVIEVHEKPIERIIDHPVEERIVKDDPIHLDIGKEEADRETENLIKEYTAHGSYANIKKEEITELVNQPIVHEKHVQPIITVHESSNPDEKPVVEVSYEEKMVVTGNDENEEVNQTKTTTVVETVQTTNETELAHDLNDLQISEVKTTSTSAVTDESAQKTVEPNADTMQGRTAPATPPVAKQRRPTLLGRLKTLFGGKKKSTTTTTHGPHTSQSTSSVSTTNV